MRCICRIAALTAVVVLARGPVALSQQPPNPEFLVTIIGVTEFSDHSLKDSQLISGIKDATDQLKSFFESKLHVNPVLFTTADQTSSGFLRDWLFNDLQKDSRPAIHLIFILTHGFAYKTPERDANKSELFLATSDTCATVSATCPKSLIGSTIRGGEFIEAFRDMPRRATVFFFIDSCGSGAIDSENLQKTLTHENDFASRLMILASAMSDESAYSARFTKTLTNIWQAPTPSAHCGRRAVEKFITSSLKAVPGTSADSPQTVRLIAPLMPDFCIESFNYNNRLLFLSNAAPGPVTVTLQPEDREPDDPIIVDQNETVPLGDLRAVNYTMVATRNDNREAVVRPIDLTSSPARVEVLFSSDPIDKIVASQSAAMYLDSRGILPSVAEEFRESIKEGTSNQRAVLQTRAERLSSEEEQVVSAVAALEVEVPKRRASVVTAQQHRDQAAERASRCGVMQLSCSNARVEFEKAEVDFGRVESESASLEAQAQDAKVKAFWLQYHRRELEFQFARLDELKKASDALEATNNAAAQVEIALRRELQPLFSDVKVTDRGVVVSLPSSVVTTRGDSQKLHELVHILNQFPSVHIEVELTQPGVNSVGEQSAIRVRAKAVKRDLMRMGLKSSSVASRGFVTIGKGSRTANIIVSP
jgi:hypothetical protein